QEHESGRDALARACLRIDYMNRADSTPGGVVLQRLHDTVRLHGQPASGASRRERGALCAEVSAHRAAAATRSAVMAWRSIPQRRGQIGHTAYRDAPLRKALFHFRLESPLDDIELHWRQKLAVRKLCQILAPATDTDEALDMRIPVADVAV